MAMSPLNVGSPSESLKRESPGASEGVVLSLRKHHVTTPLSLTTNNTQVFSVIEGQIMQEVDDVCDDVVDDVVDDVTDDVDDEYTPPPSAPAYTIGVEKEGKKRREEEKR
ncbi:hypothetical protein Pmani_029302 [Petrolisthes manimaculis]|uniref:Uncharacterized protein n=1 Tax=Petrolisthes manimaculis TaxID=1843537 RepID=A0AAE1P042_9EUCA|nr:hypothetical protein Pmani_029302 [Petrolisthes manimaculis]